MTGLLIALAAAVWSALCVAAGFVWAHRRITALVESMGHANTAIGDLDYHRSVMADYVLTLTERGRLPHLPVRGAR